MCFRADSIGRVLWGGEGFFERNGVRVMLQETPNSVAQMTGLAEGKFDIAITAVDNIVATRRVKGRQPSARNQSSSPSWQ